MKDLLQNIKSTLHFLNGVFLPSIDRGYKTELSEFYSAVLQLNRTNPELDKQKLNSDMYWIANDLRNAVKDFEKEHVHG